MSVIDQLNALEGGMPDRREMNRGGVSLARITNVTDPDKFNRVKCLPVGSENAEETDWCYVMAPNGGASYGIFWFPRVDDLVVIAYLDDDPHRPLVLGALWTTESTPPYPIEDGKVQQYALRTPAGMELLMHDEENKNKVTLTMPSGTILVLDDENEQINLQDKDGENALQMDLRGGNITLKAKTKLALSAGDTTITLESSGNIAAKGSNKLSAEGATVAVKASAKLAMQGASAEMKADTTLDLNASGPATLKGAMVKIN